MTERIDPPAATLTADGRTLPNRWLVLLILFGIAVFNHADRYLLSGLVTPIKTEFAISDGLMGLLMGPAFAVFYTSMAIPIAIYADRANRIRIIVAGCVLWSVFTILSGFAIGPLTLAAARIGVGIGEAAFQAPAYSLLAAYFPATQRGRAFAVIALAVYFGQMLAFGGGTAIAAQSDWRMAFIVMGTGGLVVIAIAALVVREPARIGALAERLPIVPMFRLLSRRPSYRWMTLGMGLGVLSGLGFGFWGIELFARSYGLSQEDAGAAFGSAFTLPGIIGALLFGFLADYLTRKGYGRMLLLSALGLVTATLAVLAAVWAASLGGAVAWAIPAGLFGGGWAVGIYAGLQYILPDRMRATGTALAMLAINILGYVIGPWLVGALASHFGEGAMGLRIALSIVVPVGIIGAIVLWLGARHMDKDREELHDAGETPAKDTGNG